LNFSGLCLRIDFRGKLMVNVALIRLAVMPRLRLPKMYVNGTTVTMKVGRATIFKPRGRVRAFKTGTFGEMDVQGESEIHFLPRQHPWAFLLMPRQIAGANNGAT
jgi:hypothetical protein